MSIIYDALQKTQRNLSNKKNGRSFQSASHYYRWIGLLLFALLIAAMIIYFYYTPHAKKIVRHSSVKPIHALIKRPATVAAPSAIPAVTPVVAQNTGRDPFHTQIPSHISATLPVANLPELNNNLQLNGVFISELEKIALINNQPYHIGDVVQGLKIITIDMDNVKLSNDKNSFIIHTIS